jgi:hypothetical protein
MKPKPPGHLHYPQRELMACVVSLRYFHGFGSAIVATSSEKPSPKGFYEEVRGVWKNLL